MPDAPRSPNPADAALMDALKTFIRTDGTDYLRDPNITSVGLGYKQIDGKTTDQLAVQFTVGRKVEPEALDALGTRLIPEAFTVGGVTIPTDVLERSYEPAYQIVAEAEAEPRKTRIDPVVPGVSVANVRVSAGTLGAIVYDRQTGVPYVLSNWHVLHGPDGQIGDTVVQPGPHDDNRVAQNRLGTLVRSHLGAAGDGAVASIETRQFDPEVLALEVAPDALGEAELGDKVIKSGRTTGVTHGVVTRIQTVVKLDYGGGVGEQQIGGFEIGPDAAHPAPQGEISMGGDSGAVWLFRASNGRTSRVMAGLHFAGEGSGDPDEHALACYPRSIFEKLEVSLSSTPAENTGEAGSRRRGYDPDFLGAPVPVPTLSAAGKRLAYQRGTSEGGEVIPYTHFSLSLHTGRRLAFWVAWNIDGSRLQKLSREGLSFVLDPDIPAAFQVGGALYTDNRLDRGHLARRADLCWGSDAEARQANRDSFFFTNIAPQLDTFNQSSRGGLWGALEDTLFAAAEIDDLRVSAFAGPLFREDDRTFRGVQLPRAYYKVLLYKKAGQLNLKAFVLSQNLDDLELLDLSEFELYQVSLAELEARSDLRFAAALKRADNFTEPEAAGIRKPLASLEEIAW